MRNLSPILLGCLLIILGACESAETVSAENSIDEQPDSAEHYHPEFPITAFNDAFDSEFYWENRGRERMVSDEFRGGSIWIQANAAATTPHRELFNALLPQLNNGPMAENPVSGCVEILSITQTFVEGTTFTSAAVNCRDQHGVVTALTSDDYVQVWLVTGREIDMGRDQAIDRSARLASALERRIWDEL